MKSCVFRGAKRTPTELKKQNPVNIRLSLSDPFCARPHLPSAEFVEPPSCCSPKGAPVTGPVSSFAIPLAWYKSQNSQNAQKCLGTLRAKGTLISEPRFSTCERRFFPHARKGKRPFQRKTLGKGRFLFLAWEKSHLAGSRKSGFTN